MVWIHIGSNVLNSKEIWGIRIQLRTIRKGIQSIQICIQMLWIPFERSNLVQRVRIWIRMLRIPFERFEFGFECFESLFTGWNFHSNTLNPFRMVRICIQMLQILFKWFEFGFKCMEFLLIVQICIRILRISFERFKFTFECFEFCSNGCNLHSNDSNLFRMVRISNG